MTEVANSSNLNGSDISDLLAEDRYEEGEKILAYHGALIYEAKVLKVEVREDPNLHQPRNYYLLHYQGWNDRWDEWVTTQRMLKYNDANKKIQEELKQEHKQAGKKSKGGSKKRKVGQDGKGDVKFKIDLPPNIRAKLVEDQLQISKKYMISIPRSPCVSDVLNDFIEHFENHSKSDAKTNGDHTNENGTHDANGSSHKLKLEDVKQVITGLRLYFNKALGTFLLYRFERRRYSDIIRWTANGQMSGVYGVEHLLRLFVKLPVLLADVQMEEESLEIIKSTVEELVKFVEDNLSKYASRYEPAPPSYIKDTQN